MAVAAMKSAKPVSARMPRDSTPQEIIASARNAPASMRPALMVSGLSAFLMWGAFTPLDFGALAWLCLVPMLCLACVERPAGRMYLALFLGGLAFWLAALQWMRLADTAMYAAWAALSVYLGLYFPLFISLVRVGVWRLRIPLTLAAPLVWVGLELLRGYLMSGFSWYYLAHSQHRWIELIQICDLVGTYGVSFLIALVSGCIAELLPLSWLSRLGMIPAAAGASRAIVLSTFGKNVRAAACLAVFAAVLAYGYVRRSGNEFQAGPRVALVQGNVTSAVKHDPQDWPKIERQHEFLTGLAVKQQPAVVVWPETMFRWPLLETPRDVSDEQLHAAHPHLPLAQLRGLKVRNKLAQLAQMSNTAMVIGLETLEVDAAHAHTYNSAVLIRPDGTIAGRYDKLHRVIFGEFIPFVETFPWLRKLTPFGEGFGIDAGQAPAVFDHNGFRFSPIICFEDTVPQLVRNIIQTTAQHSAGGMKRIDFLVNLTNDGWFHGSSELDQHLITAAFRCIEFRTPMVRAVNTGISAIIDGDGVVRRKAVGLKTGLSKLDEAVVVDTVPLDSRRSLYLAGGDWFGAVCLVCSGALFFFGIFGRWSRRAIA